MSTPPPSLMGVNNEAYPNVLEIPGYLQDGSIQEASEEERKTQLIWIIVTIFLPPLFIYINRKYEKTFDPIMHRRYKWSLNIFAFEMCCLVTVAIVLFSWWFHDAL